MAEAQQERAAKRRLTSVWMAIGLAIPLLLVSARVNAISWSPQDFIVGENVTFRSYPCAPNTAFVTRLPSSGVGSCGNCPMRGEWEFSDPESEAPFWEGVDVQVNPLLPLTRTVRFTRTGTFRVCFHYECWYWNETRQINQLMPYEDCATVTVRTTAQVGISPSASVAPPTSPALPSSPAPSPGTVMYGGYTLRLVEAIKCASVEGRPYTSLVVGAVGGGGLIHLPQVLVDSGADMSVLPAKVAQALGIDLSKCEEQKFGGVGGGTIVGRLAQVQIGITHLGGIEMDVEGYILSSGGVPFLPTITVAFVEDDSTFILGRTDAFDVFDFDFTSDTVMIRVAK